MEQGLRYSALLQHLQTGIVVHAPDTSILMSNAKAAELLDLTEDEMHGKTAIDPAWNFINEDLSVLKIEEYPVNKIIRELKPFDNLTLGVISPTKSEITWVSVNGLPVFNDDKSLKEIIISFNDISERKKMIEALRRSERDLSKAQAITHIGSWHLDIASNEVIWTEELYRMYGFDSSIPPPPYTEHKKLFTDESWELLSTSLAQTRDTGIPYELELKTVRKNGTHGWMWVRGEAEFSENGKITSLWGAAQDITERKNTEEKLRESEKQLLKKTADLEYLNNFFVNRELRMVELKKEVNELLKQLGLEKKYDY
jgi:PAS domain S-box-containing protein